MKSAQQTVNGTRGEFLKAIIKGSLLALSISLISICIFAFVLRFVDISTGAINPINQVIKFGSIILGVLVGLKNVKEMGLITGFLVGVIYTALAFFTFSLLNGAVKFETSVINDMLFGGIAGALSGIVSVNFKKK